MHHHAILVALLPLPLLALGTASVTRAQVRPVVNERVAALIEPMGIEHMVGIGARESWGDGRDMLFGHSYAEVGLVNHTSPIYSMTGGYFEVSPIAFMIVRAHMLEVEVWPIGLDGAGYFPSDNGARPSLEGATAGATSGGLSASLSVVLQGAVDIGDVRAILWNETSAEYYRLGEAPYHYSARHAFVLAQDDVILGNWAMALAELHLSTNVALRLGAYDDVRAVPRSGALNHQIGGVAMLEIERPVPEIADVTILARVGGYLERDGAAAGDVTALLAVMARYELMP
ncbi:MAG: hypothetical protein AB7S26_07800 [Sandaracinaceae bacterium]